MSFGEYFRYNRVLVGMSLNEFCWQAGLDPSNWSRVERGLKRSNADLDRIFDVLGLDVKARETLRRLIKEEDKSEELT